MADATITTTRGERKREDYTGTFCLLATQGKGEWFSPMEVLADADDFNRLVTRKWRLCRVGRALAYKALTSGMRGNIYLHRFLLEPPPHLVIDHKDRNVLNNTRKNLRVCTQAQNCINRPQVGKAKSQYKGVSWSAASQCWRANAGTRSNRVYLGVFDCEVQAARAYNAQAVEMFGEFAYLNPV